MKQDFYIHAVWDAEAGVYCSQSNIPGLHIEAETPELFEAVVQDVASELIFENVIRPAQHSQSVSMGFFDSIKKRVFDSIKWFDSPSNSVDSLPMTVPIQFTRPLIVSVG